MTFRLYAPPVPRAWRLGLGAAVLAAAAFPAHAQFNLWDLANQIGNAVNAPTGGQAASTPAPMPEEAPQAAQPAPAAGTRMCRGSTGYVQPCENGTINESDPVIQRARAMEREQADLSRRRDDEIKNFNCRTSRLAPDDTIEMCERRERANR